MTAFDNFLRRPPTGTGRIAVSPYEANLVAQAAQKRLGLARAAATRLASLRASLNRLDDRIGTAAAERARLANEARDAGDRPWHPPIPPALHAGAIFAIFVGELAVAKAAFDFLRQPELESWLMAGSLALLLLLAAKTTARVIRQHLWAHGRWPEVAFAVVANAIFVWLLFEVAQLRALLSGGGASAMANTLLQLGLYAAVAFVSLLQIPPCHKAEQRLARIARLDRQLHATPQGLWHRRAKLADQHNMTLADALAGIRAVEEDCAERVYQYRDANARARTDETPAWFRNALPAAVFEPIDLGRPVDPHPAGIDAVTGGGAMLA